MKVLCNKGILLQTVFVVVFLQNGDNVNAMNFLIGKDIVQYTKIYVLFFMTAKYKPNLEYTILLFIVHIYQAHSQHAHKITFPAIQGKYFVIFWQTCGKSVSF